MKKSLLGILFVFILVGCGLYKEPRIDKNYSLLVLEDRVKGNVKSASWVKIDGEIIDKDILHSKTTITKLKVIPGKHEIQYKPSIYYGNRAKHKGAETFILDFKVNKIYKFELIPHVMNLKSIDDDVTGTLKIYENKKLIIKRDLLLEDSIMRSTSNMTSADIADAVIQSVVLPAM